jgi:hypothetical protein
MERKCLGHSTRTICTNNRRDLAGELLVGVASVGANGCERLSMERLQRMEVVAKVQNSSMGYK